jgi:hypothetical protein
MIEHKLKNGFELPPGWTICILREQSLIEKALAIMDSVLLRDQFAKTIASCKASYRVPIIGDWEPAGIKYPDPKTFKKENG